MTKMRVIETNEGIQAPPTAELFDQFAKTMRDKGWQGVDSMLASGLPAGDLLELGPGPGYVGLELAKKLRPRTLTGCDISPAMLQIAQNNAAAYGIAVQYVLGNVLALPFENESFDGVFSNGSLHEWERPVKAFDEIYRVLRPGGRYCITDLRRDAGALRTALVYHSTKPLAMRPGLLSSLHAAYTVAELTELLRNSALCDAHVEANFFGLCITGQK